MQTFLPYASFHRSVSVLDNRRLGKQRVEAFQILNVFDRIRTNPDGRIAWRNHPAVKMWAGYEDALRLYYNFCVIEWVSRGNRNSMLLKPVQCKAIAATTALWNCETPPASSECKAILSSLRTIERHIPRPPFLGQRRFHLSHQSNLLRKDHDHYARHFPGVPPDLEYVWPSREEPFHPRSSAD